MADDLTQKSRECMRWTYGTVLIEAYWDGTVKVFADPERFRIIAEPGRGEGQNTGRLHSCVTIAPIFAQQTGLVSSPSQSSAPLPAAPHAPTILNPHDHRLRGPE